MKYLLPLLRKKNRVDREFVSSTTNKYLTFHAVGSLECKQQKQAAKAWLRLKMSADL